MQTPELALHLPGTFAWEPVFAHDNTASAAPATIRAELPRTTTFRLRPFDAALRAAVRAQADASPSVVAAADDAAPRAFAVVSAAATLRGAPVSELSATMQDLVACAHAHTERTEATLGGHKQTYVVPPRAALRLYQRTFRAAGVVYRSDAVAAAPGPDEAVDIALAVRQVAFVRDLEVVCGGAAAPLPPGRVVELAGGDGDLNVGADGRHVWLVPVYTFDAAEAASGFELADRGTHRVLRAVHDAAMPLRITELVLFRGAHRERASGTDTLEWEGMTNDINGGQSDECLYLMWKTHPAPNRPMY
ncbi:hypothetical protein PsYK624_065920 [Phanerochaete sordida]|uniref:Uncharacterized protein n=1 Tax=Phanerochaete sordida TaxID=48140 RepID=A0A9P3G8X3_9APHY|nr:hypothetical protein PsYK624_065920 [Phanerochaete sordida]